MYEASNQVTEILGGKVAASLLNGSISLFRWIAVGTGTTLEVSSSTAMEAEVDRVLCTPSLTTTVFANDTFKLSGGWSPVAYTSIGEIGIFDDASALGARGTFRDSNNDPSPKAVTVGQLATLEYFIQVAV